MAIIIDHELLFKALFGKSMGSIKKIYKYVFTPKYRVNHNTVKR